MQNEPNIGAEQAVLGAVLIDYALVMPKLATLTPEHFYRDSHRAIYKAIQALHAENNPIDLVTVATQLRAAGELDEAGGTPYLSDLANSVATAVYADYHADLVIANWKLRVLLGYTSELRHEIATGEEPVETALDKFQARVDAIKPVQGPRTTSLAAAVHRRMEAIDADEIPSPIYTGFSAIDGMKSGFNGVNRGELVTIAARPANGKTAFSVRLGLNMSRAARVLYLSLEMSEDAITDRVMGMAGEYPVSRMRELLREPSASLERVLTAIRKEYYGNKYNFTLVSSDNMRAMTIGQIERYCRDFTRKDPVDVIFIDQLSRIDFGPGGSKLSIRERYNEIIYRLKTLANELNCVLVVMHQLNRDFDKAGGNRQPRLSDLKESGRVEEESDQVWLLEWPWLADKDKPKNDYYVYIAKNRNGATGMVSLEYVPEFTLVRDKEPIRASEHWQEARQDKQGFVL